MFGKTDARGNRVISSFEQMCAVVTGGAGEVGQHVVGEQWEMQLRSIVILDKDAQLLEIAMTHQKEVYAAEVKLISDLNVPLGGTKRCIYLYSCDVTDIVRVKACLDHVTSSLHCKIDVLVNNAGSLNGTSTLEGNGMYTMETNCHSVVSMIQLMRQSYQSKQLYIMSVASAAATSYACNQGDYCASKSALVVYLKGMYQDLLKCIVSDNFYKICTGLFGFTEVSEIHTGVCMYTILPWRISTPMFHGVEEPWFVQPQFPVLSPKHVSQNLLTWLKDAQKRASVLNRPILSYKEVYIPKLQGIAIGVLALQPVQQSMVATALVGGWTGMSTRVPGYRKLPYKSRYT